MLSRPLSGDFTIRFMHYYIHSYIHSCTMHCYLGMWNFHYHIHQGSKHFSLAGNMASSTSTPFAALWQSAAERTRIFELLARLICLKLMRLLFRNLDPRLVLDIVFTSYRLRCCHYTTRHAQRQCISRLHLHAQVIGDMLFQACKAVQGSCYCLYAKLMGKYNTQSTKRRDHEPRTAIVFRSIFENPRSRNALCVGNG